jgi:hypothetical protein
MTGQVAGEVSESRLWRGVRELGWLLIFAFFLPVAVLLIVLPFAAVIRLIDSFFSR